MKVLMIHNYYRTSAPSGEDIVVANEKRMLERHCEVISYVKRNDDLDESSFGTRVSMAANALWNKTSFVEIRRVISQHKPTLMHVHNTFPQISPSAYAAAKAEKLPVLQTLHNYRLSCANGLLLRDGVPCELCLKGLPYPALHYKCYRGSLPATATVVGIQLFNRMIGSYRNNIDTFIALTRFAKEKMLLGNLRDANFVVKPNFLPDPPIPGPYPRERQAIFVGRLTEEKGVWTLIRAWAGTKGYRLLIVGDGGLRGELEKYVAENKLDVQFLGHRARREVLELISACALQIVPSICYEGFPMVVLEAYACGTAILASALGGLAETVVEGVTGRQFPPGDVDTLRSKINWMLESGETEQLGRAGRDLFEKEFTESRNSKQLLDIYEHTLAKRA